MLMSTATLERTIPDVPDGFELVNGELVEIEPMSFYSVEVANLLRIALESHSSTRKGRVRMGDLYYFVPTREDPSKIRKPDLVYASYKTWPLDKPLPYTGNAVAIVPELVVEIISPTDDAEDVIAKARQYLKAGVKSVWLVYPGSREIQCYDTGGTIRSFAGGETLDGRPVLPGFKLNVDSIFPAIAPDAA